MLQVPYQRLEGRRCIAVNNSYRLAPWAELAWFGDIKWWDWHRQELLASGIPIATCCENVKLQQEMGEGDRARIRFFNRDGDHRFGLTTRTGPFVSWNRSSGGAAISLCHRLGARTIVLLGFDMRRVEGEKNWHQDHKEPRHVNPFRRHLTPFLHILEDAAALGISILNATPGSAIHQFPFINLEDLL